MAVRSPRALPPVLLLAVAFFWSGAATAYAEPPNPEKVKEKLLAVIRQQLSYKGDKATTWYVIQLQEVATSTTSSTISIRSTVKLEKVQGQDAAAQLVYDFLKAPSACKRVFYVDRFRDSESVQGQVDDYMAKLIVSGMLKGYRPAGR